MARQPKKDPKAFAPAPEVKNLIRDIVYEHYPHLQGTEIHAIFATENQVVKGERVLATTSRISGRTAWLAENFGIADEQDDPTPFFLIEVGKPTWDQLDAKQRRALIDHQVSFCHVTKTGTLKIKNYDIQEFAAVVHRHGFWRKGIEDFVKVANNATAQNVLPLEPEKAAASTPPPPAATTPEKPKSGGRPAKTTLTQVPGGASASA